VHYWVPAIYLHNCCSVDRLLNDLRGIRRPTAPPEDDIRRAASVKPETEQMRERLMLCFQQWVTIYQRSPSLEKSFIPYITSISKQGILKVEEVSSFFFRVCAEASVGHYMECVATVDYTFAFQALDAMSRLIVYIIKYHGDPTGVDNEKAKTYYFRKILSIFVLVLANMHEEHGVTFPQKPFFRFFSSLVNDLHSLEDSLGATYMPLLVTLRCVGLYDLFPH
jgi:CCR4-NOT transcription complex subunit 1